MRRQMVLRIRIITGCILFLSVILIGRLYQLQVLQNDYYTEKAERQYIHTKQDLYSRGSIYFTTKEGEKVSAASVRSGYVLALNPAKIIDAQSLCENLTTHVEVTAERCVDRATLADRTYVELDTAVSDEDADAIAALKLYLAQHKFGLLE